MLLLYGYSLGGAAFLMWSISLDHVLGRRAACHYNQIIRGRTFAAGVGRREKLTSAQRETTLFLSEDVFCRRRWIWRWRSIFSGMYCTFGKTFLLSLIWFQKCICYILIVLACLVIKHYQQKRYNFIADHWVEQED
jgi:hypothetical protein